MRRARGLTALLAMLLASLLAACSVLPESKLQQVYGLLPAAPAPAANAAPARAAPGFTLRVLTPYSNRMLAGTRILVRPQGSSLNVYEGARWTDPAPVMLRDRLVAVFRADGRLGAVSNDSAQLASDLSLGGDLNHFEVAYEGERPVVHIQWDALLIEPLDARIVASRRFRVRQPAATTQLEDVVQAFGQAADRLLRDMRDWTLREGAGVVKGEKG